MNKQRLLKLADLLKADAKNKKGLKFDLSTVGESSDWLDGEEFRPGVDCGTTACAMGLAAVSGAFKRAGLSYRVDDDQINTTMNGRRVGYDRAAMRLFGISLGEADFLFTPSYYFGQEIRGAVGERLVARRIRDFVAGKVKPEKIEISW
jgi:hypothetical protein